MLATLTEQLPGSGSWVYEPKLHGVRALELVAEIGFSEWAARVEPPQTASDRSIFHTSPS